MTSIIVPKKPRLSPDPFIAPVYGTRGPCALCLNYSDLTQNHVPPESVGNSEHWIARSYLAASTANRDLYFGRQFKGGLRFRTLCADCNNGLGGKQDKVIGDFFECTRKLIESPIILAPTVQVTTKPNHIYKGLLAHIVSANDSGAPSTFDAEARDLFFGRKNLKSSTWNLFYWIYTNPKIFVMRNAYFTIWQPRVEIITIQIIKFYPLSFMFTQEPWFYGLPNMRLLLQSRDDEEVDVPIQVGRRDGHQFWPVTAEPSNMILLAGNTFGLIGESR